MLVWSCIRSISICGFIYPIVVVHVIIGSLLLWWYITNLLH
jgi:hypothetical protein